MAVATNLGFPRLGPHRELKRALEDYWARELSGKMLQAAGAALRRENWQRQASEGIEHIPSNDFSLYDHVLDAAVMVDAIPARFRKGNQPLDLEGYFAMARGTAGGDTEGGLQAMEMTKWFDTNYHYIVPEFEPGQLFRLASTKPVDEFLEAKSLGIHTRPVLLGPVTFLLLGKVRGGVAPPLSLLEGLLPVYEELLRQLCDSGCDWVQLDEPCLGPDPDESVRESLEIAYGRLSEAAPGLKLLLATYFSDLRDSLETALALPVAGLHLDLVRGPDQLIHALDNIKPEQVLSMGVVDGRNIWQTDLDEVLPRIALAVEKLGTERVLIGPSCSLLHCPVDLELETGLDETVKSWLAFARQKVREIAILTTACRGRELVAAELAENKRAIEARRRSPEAHNAAVKERLASLSPAMLQRQSPSTERRSAQQEALGLPPFPTTTIGSFPQTREVRKSRADFKKGRISKEDYRAFLREEITRAIRVQEELSLDVLVHGEAERTDMVEYFGEQLQGFLITSNGWVQSYGSRCVKPPIIYGDVSRSRAITVEWTTYAQSLTERPVKGMLTGPVTILEWSFVRDDQPRSETCRQIALAVRDEVKDLEDSGIQVIQIDEPGLREGLPLCRADWDEYLRWSVDCFRLASAGVKSITQVHTHMCYADFADIIEAIAELDVDVLSIEASRSDMEALDVFARGYSNGIGPGVFDIHSPRIASVTEMEDRLVTAASMLGPDQIWVNPDCGLKTRSWDEVERSLRNMGEAARSLRRRFAFNWAPGQT